METIENIRQKLQECLTTITCEEKRINELQQKMEEYDIEELSNLAIDINGKSYYPNILDKNFTVKLFDKKEFYENRYDIVDYTKMSSNDLKKEATNLCEKDFEIAPHQAFVRNFLSHLTPYNGLLLYHGLGTGKTCTAISVCENMRDYMKQMNYTNRIIIVASPNIQKNFESQLFNKKNLHFENGRFTMKGCVGNKLLNEALSYPFGLNILKKQIESSIEESNANHKNVDEIIEGHKENLVTRIDKIIHKSYSFMGYIKFSNYIESIHKPYKKSRTKQHVIAKEFSNRLIVIDEVHNIRVQKDGATKTIIENLIRIAKYATNVKFVFMSATPIFDEPTEIINLLNLLHINDGRPIIKKSEIFDRNGFFVKDKSGTEIGKQRLEEKSRGYISFIKGSNIYTFPYRMFPSQFDSKRSITFNEFTYPIKQVNNVDIIEPIQFMDLYMSYTSPYQDICYQHIKNKFISKTYVDTDEYGISIRLVDRLKQTLNFAYPNKKAVLYGDTVYETTLVKDKYDPYDRNSITLRDSQRERVMAKIRSEDFPNVNEKLLYGSGGLNACMDVIRTSSSIQYSYKQSTITNYGRIFNFDNIGNYSHKIHAILKCIEKSKGVILIYSQYIEGGCVPLALALEEYGIKRYGRHSSILKTDNIGDIEERDTNTMYTKTQYNQVYKSTAKFKPAKYMIITGDSTLSYEENELKVCTDNENKNGENIRVVIISRAGSEGLDFKFIRQVHILDTWFNNNRNEQIIGRAIRYCSHAALPFEERNVEIYLHATQFIEAHKEESIDLFMYRTSETKSLKIGTVTRTLKQSAVDCIITPGNHITPDILVNQTVNQNLSSNITIQYKVGDKPFSEICDYMESCVYDCKPNKKDNVEFGKDGSNYNQQHISFATDNYIDIIKSLFKEHFFITKQSIINRCALKYPIDSVKQNVDYAINTMIQSRNEYIKDMFGRTGQMFNIGDTYFFQPIELQDSVQSYHNIVRPLPLKIERIKLEMGGKQKTIIESSDIQSEVVTLYNIIKTGATKSQQEYEWFRYAHKVLHNHDIMQRFLDAHSISTTQLYKYTLHHILDMFSHEKKVKLIENIYNNIAFTGEQSETTKFIFSTLKDYINTHYTFTNKNTDENVVLITNNSKVTNTSTNNAYYTWDAENKTLQNSEKLLIERVNRHLTTTETYKYITIVPSSKPLLNLKVIGYMYPQSKKLNTGNEFKMKDPTTQGGSGTKCINMAKQEVIKFLISITDFNKDECNKIQRIELCIILEFILRYYDETKKDNKKWFLTSEISMWNNIEKKQYLKN